MLNVYKSHKQAKSKFDFSFKVLAIKDASGEVVIEGYANTSTKDRVGDVVLPKAFEKSLPTYLKNPVLLENHNWEKIAGRVLSAEITDKGLYIKARISDTRADLKTLVQEGCLSTFSIGYNELDADYDESTKTKIIKDLELLEISIVSVPANTEAAFTVSTVKEPAAEDAAKTSVAQGGEPACPHCNEPTKWSQPDESYKCEKCGEMVAAPAKADPAQAETKIERHQGESMEACVSRGIATLINEGKEPDQAAAIAYSMCGEKSATALDLKGFIETAIEAAEDDLDSESLVALCGYFIENGAKMKKLNKKQLVEALRASIKSASATSSAAPAAAAPAADAAKADPAAPAEQPSQDGGDMMKQCMAKLDAIAQGVASLLEMAKEDQAEDSQEDQADAGKPAEDGKPAEAPAPAKDAAGAASEDEKSLDSMSDEELEQNLAEIDGQLSELEEDEE